MVVLHSLLLEGSVFSQAWGFEHTLTSPYNSQSNGKAESALKIARRLLKRSKDPIGVEPYYWYGFKSMSKAVGSMDKGSSSNGGVQMDPAVEPHVLEKKLKKQKLQILRSKWTLPPLAIGQPVLAQDMLVFKTQWDRGTCVGHLSDRSYVVDIDDHLVQRNCWFLMGIAMLTQTLHSQWSGVRVGQLHTRNVTYN